MLARAIFLGSAFLSLVSSAVFAKLYAWPSLRARNRDQALAAMVAPHMFLRFIGMSFLVVGVVSPSLPVGFAAPAAYGDLAAGILAIIATVALARGVSWAMAAVWVFNVWGATDLLFAVYETAHLRIPPGAFGAAFFLPTAIVPMLLVSHYLILRLLIRKEA